MLVVDRRKDEAVVIFDTVTGDQVCRVSVGETRRDRAKIGVEAAQRFVIVREELCDRDERGQLRLPTRFRSDGPPNSAREAG